MAVDERSDLEEALSRWQLDAAAVREQLYRAPTARERERWHALWLALQGWSSAQVATALGRDPHMVGTWWADVRRAWAVGAQGHPGPGGLRQPPLWREGQLLLRGLSG